MCACVLHSVSLKSERPAVHGALKNLIFILYLYDTRMSMEYIDTVEKIIIIYYFLYFSFRFYD